MMNDITLQELAVKPLYIRMHDNDNVAIVVNDGGLPTTACGRFTSVACMPISLMAITFMVFPLFDYLPAAGFNAPPVRRTPSVKPSLNSTRLISPTMTR